MSRHGLLTGLCAASLSVALLAGCSSPVVPPTTTPAADNTNQLTTTPVSDASTGAPVTAAPAAVTPATLNGKATFRGEALSGYTVSVLDAQTGKPAELRADLAGATGLAVLNQNLMTDANGAFSLQVVGLKAGQALRVLVTKGNATLETVVTSNLTVLGAKKYLVLDAGSADGLTVDELTTSIAKIARGVIATTRLLTADEAAPILAKLSEQLNAISTKLSATLAANAGLASSVIDANKGDENVKALVKSAGVIADVNKTVAGLVAEIAKGSKDRAVDPNVATDLAKIGYLGTDLDGALANGKITLTNRETGEHADATGDTSNVTKANTNNGGSHSAPLADVFVTTEAELLAAVADTANLNKTIGLNADIALSAPLKISQKLTIFGNGKTLTKGLWLNAAGVTLKNLTIYPAVISAADPTNPVCVYAEKTGAVLDAVTMESEGGYGVLTLSGGAVALTVKNSTFNSFTTGIYCNPGTVLTATGNTFMNSTAAIGSDESNLTGTISGNTFTNNTEDIGLNLPVLNGGKPSVLKAKLMANNTGAAHVNFYGLIDDAAELRTALASGASTLNLNDAFTNDGDPYVVDRAVTIVGNGVSLTSGFEVKKPNVTIKNLTITGRGFNYASSTDAGIWIQSGSTSSPVTLDHVTVNYNAASAVNLNAVATHTSYVVIKDCDFTTVNQTPNYPTWKVTDLYLNYGKLEVTNTHFHTARGIVVYSDGSLDAELTDVENNVFDNLDAASSFGVLLYGPRIVHADDADVDATAAYLKAQNTFGGFESDVR